MGNARKETMKLTRAEAAERLRALATHVEQGIILLGNEAIKVPEELRLEIETESDENEVEVEVELKWKPTAMAERSDEAKRARPEQHTPPR